MSPLIESDLEESYKLHQTQHIPLGRISLIDTDSWSTVCKKYTKMFPRISQFIAIFFKISSTHKKIDCQEFKTVMLITVICFQKLSVQVQIFLICIFVTYHIHTCISHTRV